MNDFSFSDSLEEENSGYNQDPNEKKKIIKFIIIVVVAAIAGFTVYFITDALINGNKKDEVVVAKDIEMDLNDEMVVYLYDNVTYAVNGIRSDKFFKSGSVSAKDFTTQEKIYFALRYATERDFVDMSVSDGAANGEKTLKTYSISDARIKEYVYNFFGEDVSYTTETPVNIAVNFLKDGYNAGLLKYDNMTESWLVVFDRVSAGGDIVINPYLYKLDSAIREGKTDNIVIKEKVVFTDVKQQTDEAGATINKYDCAVYKDFAKTNQLEMKNGVDVEQLTLLGIENYLDNSSVVTYRFFKDENDEYHFLSSEITSE